MVDGFRVRGLPRGLLSGQAEILHGLGGIATVTVMVRHQLGLGRNRVGELGLQHLGHLLVILLPRALEQGGIRRILHQGMLKDVFGARRTPPLVEQLGVDQLRQPLLQQRFLHAGQGPQHLVGKLPPQDRAELGHLADHRQAIQPRHQGILERGRDRHRRQGTGERIALRLLVQHVRLQQHLGELFDEQRHPIGPGDNVRDHLRR